MKKELIALSLSLCILLSLSACCGKEQRLSTAVLPVEHEPEFGGAYICTSIEDFCALGFAYGDSVDVAFSNGHTLEDIPFYNGYYGRTGTDELCAYPGDPYVKAAVCFGEDLFLREELDDSSTAVITLRTAGKYLTVQNVMNTVYTNEREDYADDEVFANFRSMKGGRLKEGLIYRSASPCDNEYNRADYAAALCEKAGIGYILDLADSEESLATCYGSTEDGSAYWQRLCAEGKILPLGMSSNYRGEAFVAATVKLMRAILREEGPFLVHCLEGKDRTGVVCYMLGVLAGADYEELRDDFMITYENYYGLDPQGESYAALVSTKFDDIALTFSGVEDVAALNTETLRAGVEQYLLAGGMSPEEIAALEAAITE